MKSTRTASARERWAQVALPREVLDELAAGEETLAALRRQMRATRRQLARIRPKVTGAPRRALEQLELSLGPVEISTDPVVIVRSASTINVLVSRPAGATHWRRQLDAGGAAKAFATLRAGAILNCDPGYELRWYQRGALRERFVLEPKASAPRAARATPKPASSRSTRSKASRPTKRGRK